MLTLDETIDRLTKDYVVAYLGGSNSPAMSVDGKVVGAALVLEVPKEKIWEGIIARRAGFSKRMLKGEV